MDHVPHSLRTSWFTYALWHGLCLYLFPLPSPLGQEQVARRWRAALSPCLTQKLRDLLNSVGTAPSAASGENKAEPWLNPGTAAQIRSNLS